MNRRTPAAIEPLDVEAETPAAPNSVAQTGRRRTHYLFLICAWACYSRWVFMSDPLPASSATDALPPGAHGVHGMFPGMAPGVEGPGSDLQGLGTLAGTATVRPGLEILAEGGTSGQGKGTAGVSSPASESHAALKELPDSLHPLSPTDDDESTTKGAPMIGATLALSGKCASPDYGTRMYYIKTKHTGSGKLAGILRRIGSMHAMEVHVGWWRMLGWCFAPARVAHCCLASSGGRSTQGRELLQVRR